MDDTGEIRQLAKEIYQARTRPIDVALVVVTAIVLIAAALWALPIVDTDRYSVDGTRWVMAMASVLSAVAATVGGVYVLDRRSRRRYDEVSGHLDTLRAVVCHNATAVGELAAQVGQIAESMRGAPTDVDVKEIAMKSFDTGRRVGRKEATEG